MKVNSVINIPAPNCSQTDELSNNDNTSTFASSCGMAPPLLASNTTVGNPQQLVASAQGPLDEAKKCGVDIAKRGFIAKLLTLAASSAVLVAAALLTGVTGGAGIPLLALASVGFVLAVGDVACASYDWYSKAHGGEGMAMGGDSLGNTMHWLARKCGAEQANARKIATYGSLLSRGALALSTVAVGSLLPVATSAALHSGVLGASLGSNAMGIATNSVNANAVLLSDKKRSMRKTTTFKMFSTMSLTTGC